LVAEDVRSVSVVVGALMAGVIAYFLGLRRSRFERLEEKRAEVLAELSGLLFDVEDRYKKWYEPSLRRPEAGHRMDEIKGKVAERAKATVDSMNAFTRCYRRNAAWLDPALAARIESSIGELHEMFFEYGKAGADNTFFQVSEGGVEAAKMMDDRIPKIRAELVGEFRGILRPLTAWSVLRALVTTPNGRRKLTAPDSQQDR